MQTNYQELIKNQNIRTFLDLIAATEGVKHGYNTGFGNTQLSSLDDHPRQSKNFKQTDGKKNTTTAAGRYQFLQGTWDEAAKAVGAQDFGPASQDMAAVYLLKRAGALDDVLKGNFDAAVKKSGSTWASLPSSKYAQPKKSKAFVDSTLARLRKTGATPAPTGVIPMPATAPAAAPTPLTPAQQLIADNAAPPIAAPPVTPPAPTSAWAAQVADIQAAGEPVPTDTSSNTDPWENRLMADALTTDMDTARAKAVSSFFGDTYVPQVQLPPSIDESINRYLAKLA